MMELPQQRPFSTDGRKATHDFLSVYSHSGVQQDPRPSSQEVASRAGQWASAERPSQSSSNNHCNSFSSLSSSQPSGQKNQSFMEMIKSAKGSTQDDDLEDEEELVFKKESTSPIHNGVYLKTHDFLQPLERGVNTAAKEETNEEVSTLEKPPPPTPPPTSVEHVLPGGIGTYSISHISYFNQRVPKPEGSIFSVAQASSTDKNEEHSNCSSYTGSGFALWEESALKKGKTGKENLGERSNTAGEVASRAGQWASAERPSQSSSNNHRNSFSSLSSSQPSGQKNQSFMEMIKSAKGSTQDDDLEDEEELVFKKESTSPIHNGELRIKVDGKSTDQKANTPRSKHSATEQRRRSKINDRFQMLRQLIPHGDQKRDKASFLLEVIEYIQFLQEKVQKYEGSYQGWNHEPEKLVPWRNNQSTGLNSSASAALLFAAKLDEKNIPMSPTIHGSAQTPVESDMSSAATFKAMENHPVIINKATPFPVSPVSLQPNFFNRGRTGGAGVQLTPRLASDAENLASLPQNQSGLRSCSADGAAASDKLKQQETIDGGTINISSVYSQGLLNTLTKALQSSGADLSQASISVQIELGKRLNAPTCITKDNEIPSSNRGIIRNRSSSEEEPDQTLKKLKTSKT